MIHETITDTIDVSRSQSQLSSALRAAQTSAETESAAAGVLRAGLARLLSRVAALHTLHGDCAPLVGEYISMEGGGG